MKVAKSIAALGSWRSAKSARVVFVPTMGALHAGHETLIRAARKLAGRRGFVVVSIFVNPTQFGPAEDFSSYPRPFRKDLGVCRDAGADLVWDLHFPVKVVGHPIVREPDGLAMSSRNAYLTAVERSVAPLIHDALQSAARRKSAAAIEAAAKKAISAIPGARLDYVSAVDAATLAALKNRKSPGRLAVAVFLGKARLIDNIPLPSIP